LRYTDGNLHFRRQGEGIDLIGRVTIQSIGTEVILYGATPESTPDQLRDRKIRPVQG
jgi:hypothetical protein